MRLKMTALVASALAGFLYMSAPSASALTAPSRSDVTTPNAKTGVITEDVHYRRGYRRWGGYRGYDLRILRIPALPLLRIPALPVLLRRLRRVRIPVLLSPAPGLRHLLRLLTPTSLQTNDAGPRPGLAILFVRCAPAHVRCAPLRVTRGHRRRLQLLARGGRNPSRRWRRATASRQITAGDHHESDVGLPAARQRFPLICGAGGSSRSYGAGGVVGVVGAAGGGAVEVIGGV